MRRRGKRRMVVALGQAWRDLHAAVDLVETKVLAEGAVGVAVAHEAELAVMAVTPDRVLWRFVRSGWLVSQAFATVTELAFYGPTVRVIFGELDAYFAFDTDQAGLLLRQCLLDRAIAVIREKNAGELLAAGSGYLEQIAVDGERFTVTVQARGVSSRRRGARLPRAHLQVLVGVVVLDRAAARGLGCPSGARSR